MLCRLIEKEVIEKYLGIPFEHQGRTMKGLDCYGLMMLVYKDMGVDLLDFAYEPDWQKHGYNHFVENYYKQWIEIKTPEPFDIVLFKNSKGIVTHGGVVLSNDRIIHASKQGVVLWHKSKFKDSIVGYYRLND